MGECGKCKGKSQLTLRIFNEEESMWYILSIIKHIDLVQEPITEEHATQPALK